MSPGQRLRSDRPTSGVQSPTDDFLVASLLGGDHEALVVLMGRYDRLVRYTIFRASRDRCARDPQWLESVASATWAGFVQSMQRHPANRPRSLATYLVRVARNHAISAIRTAKPAHASLDDGDDSADVLITSSIERPVEELARLELLETLRACIQTLEEDDRALASQLVAITERRWKDAADALGLPESTLRSRWKRTLERLRACVEEKSGGALAPSGPMGDL